MSLLVRSLALIELLGMGRARAAWTDVVGVGVVRRPILRKIAMFSQGLSHLRLDPVQCKQQTRVPQGAQDQEEEARSVIRKTLRAATYRLETTVL
jgi:hypothetical protein